MQQRHCRLFNLEDPSKLANFILASTSVRTPSRYASMLADPEELLSAAFDWKFGCPILCDLDRVIIGNLDSTATV